MSSSGSSRSKPRVAAVVLNWNRPGDSEECLRSVLQSAGPEFSILFVDNGSTDGSAERIRGAFPGIEVLALPTNVGFAGGCNAGLRRALETGADYALLLSNDIVVAPDMTADLVAAADSDPRIGLAGPVMYYYASRERVWAAGGRASLWTGLRAHLRLAPDSLADVDYIPGAALMIRAEVLRQVGFVPEGYEAYFEDLHYAVAVRRAGYRVVCVPRARMWHKVSLTYGGEESPRVKYFATRNRIRFMRRAVGSWRFRLFAGLITAINGVELTVGLLRGNAAKARAVFRGYMDGFRA